MNKSVQIRSVVLHPLRRGLYLVTMAFGRWQFSFLVYAETFLILFCGLFNNGFYLTGRVISLRQVSLEIMLWTLLGCVLFLPKYGKLLVGLMCDLHVTYVKVFSEKLIYCIFNLCKPMYPIKSKNYHGVKFWQTLIEDIFVKFELLLSVSKRNHKCTRQ